MSRQAAWLVLAVVVSAALLAGWLSGRGGHGAPAGHRATPPSTAASSPRSKVPRTPRPVATVTRTVTAAPSVPAPTSRTPWQGTVVHVADGDTLDVESRAGRVRVRLLDVDAPETAHGSPAQCGAEASTVALRTLVLGKVVQVVPDQVGEVSDRFGRALAYVELPGTGAAPVDVGAELVRTGMAEAWHPVSMATPSRDAAYRSLAARARAARAGNWATCATQGR